MQENKLSEIRSEIDEIDMQIQELLRKRYACSRRVAYAKLESGDLRIYRPEREQEILDKLGNDAPEGLKMEYLSVVRKIIETSRLYQYGILYDRLEDAFEKAAGKVVIPAKASKVRFELTRLNRPGSMSPILSMIGDYGYDMEKLVVISEDEDQNTVTFALTIHGDLNTEEMKRLMFRLSMESQGFRIVDVF